MAGKQLPVKKQGGSLVSHREMLKDLYTVLALKVFHFSKPQLEWMHDWIDNKMTETDVRREWGFLKAGHAKDLLGIFMQMDKLDEVDTSKLGDLWESLAKGLVKYKQEGKEIPREDYKFMHDAINNLTKELKQKLLNADKPFLEQTKNKYLLKKA